MYHSNVLLFIRFVHFNINNNSDILHSVFVTNALCILSGKEYRAQEQEEKRQKYLKIRLKGTKV